MKQMWVICPVADARWVENVQDNLARQSRYAMPIWVSQCGAEVPSNQCLPPFSTQCDGKLFAIEAAMRVLGGDPDVYVAVFDQDDYYPADSLAKKATMLDSGLDLVAQARGEVRLSDGRVLQFEQPEDGEELRPGEACGAFMAWRGSAYVAETEGQAMGDGQRLMAAMMAKGAKAAFGRFGDVYVRHKLGHIWEIQGDELEAIRTNTRGRLLTVNGKPFAEPA